jgi:glycosyltransferase involved in cell wall biosynthesis
VAALRNQGGYRVDGLGRCMHTENIPEGISLGYSHDPVQKLSLKQKAISNYMFHLSFENSFETGYVTEKVFDALIAGTVPVYLGATNDCRKLLPDSKAVIFVEDFNNDIPKLAVYLRSLSENRTSYEEHRAWRANFSEEAHRKLSPLLSTSWTCRICQWAANFHIK